MTTTIRVRGPEELLAYIPFRLGFTPRDSIVAVSLRGSGSVGLVARADIEALADPCSGAEAVSAMTAPLLDDGAERVLLAAYIEAADRTVGSDDSSRQAMTGLMGDLASAGVRTSAWVVGKNAYWCMECPEHDCCPAPGRDYDEIRFSVLTAHMVAAGAVVAGSRHEATKIAPASPDDRRRARRASRGAANSWIRARRPADPGDRGMALVQWRRRMLSLWFSLLADTRRRLEENHAGAEPGSLGDGVPGADPTAAPRLGRLAAGLSDVIVRDAVLLSVIPAEPGLAQAAVDGADVDAGTAEAIGRLIDPGDARYPDEAMVVAARRVLEDVIAHAASEFHPPALALAGLLAWWCGDGVLARDRIDGALREDPQHRLAVLVRNALDLGVPPGWARRESSR